MKKVRAKFNCHYVEEHNDGAKTVHMNAAVSGSVENESFSEYTPAGNLSIRIDKGDAKEYFKEGKEYYLDFTEA